MFSTSRRALTTRALSPIFSITSRRTYASAMAAAAGPLSPDQIDIVKSTAPVLREHGSTITSVFYKNMLDAHPELKNIFSMTSQANGRQPRALADAVLAYATHIDNLPALTHAVERIAHKHASLFVTAEQYDIVGTHLLGAIGQVLGAAATPEIVSAWTNAYGNLAQVFIKREAQLYDENGSWKGWRKFKVARKVPESANIISLYLEPADGVKLPDYLPGQYISLQVKPPSLPYRQSRQYSMSIAPRKEGDYYRVSVKREAGVEGASPPGMVSNMLHDTIGEGDEVELSHPQGEFFVDTSDASKAGVPLVLLSAGVGATPMMSILNAVVAKGDRPVSWIQAAVDERSIPFTDQVKAIADANRDTVAANVFLESDGVAGPYKGFAAGHKGRIVLEDLDGEKDLFVRNDRTEYCVCGPEAWMMDMRRGLVDMGVGKDRIALELFDTGDVPDE